LGTQSAVYTTNDWLGSDAYDRNGNTLWSTNGTTVTGPYGYDVQNRLTNYNNSVYVGYDGDGNRVWKRVGTTTTWYLVEDRNPSGYAQVVEEWTNNSTATNLSRVYNYGLSLISQRAPGVSTNYFIWDGHGSTRVLADTGGNTANVFAYDAYGTLIASNGMPGTAYLYCGQQWDGDLGLYDNHARYLNVGTGRFWTSDSYEGNNEDPLSLHKYIYCKADPIDGIDPSGNDGELVSLMTTVTTIGRVAGQVGFSTLQAYNRASAIVNAVQDVSMVEGALANEDFDGADDIINQILYDYVKSRLEGYALGAALGVGGKTLGIAAGQLSRLKITQSGIQRTQNWYRNLKVRRADGMVTTKSGYQVQIKNGFPDFSPFAVKTVKIKLTGNYSGDFDAADAAAGISKGWRDAKNLVWHHNQQLGKMELVSKDLNNPADGGLWHAGGVKIFELLYGTTYGN
jgi:RHS repeat-associated protein